MHKFNKGDLYTHLSASQVFGSFTFCVYNFLQFLAVNKHRNLQV